MAVSEDSLRQLALSLPEVEERETWGETTFRVREKIFVILSLAGDVASVKASLVDQAALVEADPETFAVSPYTGRFGWITVQLRTVGPDVLRLLVVNAWRRTAPRRLAARYDDSRRG